MLESEAPHATARGGLRSDAENTGGGRAAGGKPAADHAVGRPEPLRGRVHTIETFGTVDGPGVRYVVFLQGCPLSCAYCHNRDSWERSGGTLTDIKAIGSELQSLAPFYRDGGVTVTGGEPLVQPAFCRAIFDVAHNLQLNTALDTSGHAILSPLIHGVLDACDLVLLDFKHGTDEGYRRLVRAPLAGHLAPLENVERIDLLPYHELGRHKWEAKGRQCTLQDVETPKKKSKPSGGSLDRDRHIEFKDKHFLIFLYR